MNKLIAVSALMLTSVPAFAAVVGNVPEPGVLALFAAGGIAFYISRRMKK